MARNEEAEESAARFWKEAAYGEPSEGMIDYDDKMHHRVVFTEVGKTINDLDSALEICEAIGQTSLGKLL